MNGNNIIFFISLSVENRSIELHSPDGIHSCVLRATDPQEALAWFNALHSAMARNTQKALQDANRALATLIGELKYIGWLSRRALNEQVHTSAGGCGICVPEKLFHIS